MGELTTCNCERRALRLISNTEAGLRHPFYKYLLWKNKARSCEFFSWESEMCNEAALSEVQMTTKNKEETIV